jgi:hypothetical protein
MLQQWVSFVREMQSTNSRIVKATIVQKYHLLTPMWYYMYSPSCTTGITSKSIRNYERIGRPVKRCKVDVNILKLLYDLSERNLTGHAALKSVWEVLDLFPECQDELIVLFDGNPRLGIDLNQMNKALIAIQKPTVCDTFDVVLAHPFSDRMFSSITHDWYVSRKYDGVRTIVEVTTDGIKVRTRHGAQLLSLQPVFEKFFALMLKPSEDQWPFASFVIDAETCVLRDGHEDFSKSISALRQAKVAVTDFRMYMFDLISTEDFRSGYGVKKWSYRVEDLKQLSCLKDDVRLVVLEHELYSEASFGRWQQRKEDGKWEGLMLRKDVGYIGKRTHDLLKIKSFRCAEYVVRDITVNTKQILNEWGVKVDRPTMASAVITHKGNYVGVGSGFTDAQRLEFFVHPERIIGKTIEVQYFEECQNKNGVTSLRFPTVKLIWGDQRDL